MLKLQNVDKYYNRRKSNEIHVINETSLEFGETGLVALLGPSGCGKTTLLNVIGGLDKPDSGNIYINGQKLTGRSSGIVDKVRNLNIGYIFQDYCLIDDMTVFENVAMVLRMVGIKDKEEIREKVEYALNLVGMYRYRKRYADMLSGGERQRVGIARAIVKNPSIIIADEPTGNLDSANTLEVMNIIKAISREKLVILVTHEEDLADFYADRIIRLKDGMVVSDEINDKVKDLDYRIENKIYLKDIKDQRVVRDDDYSLRIFNDSGAKMNMDIVLSHGNIFIKTRDTRSHVEIVGEGSSIEFVEDHYKALTPEEAEARKYHPDRLEASHELRYSSILNPLTMLTSGFRTVGNYHILKKILLVGFLISAMFITYAVSSIAGIMNLPDEKFVMDDKSYIGVVQQNITVEDYLKYESDPSVEYALPGPARITMRFQYDEYWQTSPGSVRLSGSLSSSSSLSEDDLIYGRLPNNGYELAIDKLVLTRLLEKDKDIIQAGYKTPDELIGRHLTLKNLPDFTIVGITDKQSPCIYAADTMLVDMLACSDNTANVSDEDGFGYDFSYADEYDGDGDDADESGGEAAPPNASDLLDYVLFRNELVLANGDSRWPENDYEVLVDSDYSESMKLGSEIKTKVGGHKLKVVGYYDSDTIRGKYFVSPDTIKYRVILEQKNMTVKALRDKEETMSSLRSDGASVRDLYQYEKSQYRKSRLSMSRAFLIVGGIILIISLIEVFLMMRASFMSRIKEVGTLRAIGVKKSDVYRMFIGEIIAITIIASLPGWLLMNYIIEKLQNASYFSDMFTCTPQTILASIALILAFNLIFGLLPVMNILIRRPAEILARTDIN